MSELWKDVKGFEGKYFVSTKGRVRANTQLGERLIKPWKDDYGYLVVDLYREGTVKERVKVHRLVALNFIDNPDKKETVNHIDGNKSNNEVNNLEWMTFSENTAHAHRVGLIPRGRIGSGGADNYSAKLTELDVMEIRKLYESKEKTIKELSSIFDVHYTTIRRVVIKESWK